MAHQSNADVPIIRTNRLILSPFHADDADELLTLFRNADVRRYLLDDQLVDREWVDQEIETSQQRFSADSIGIWSIRRRQAPGAVEADESIIGFVGFRPFFEPPELQLIYGMLSSAWGTGYATESAQAAIAYGFQTAGLDHVVAATDRPNKASVRVMERLGMQPDRVTDDEDQGTLFYRLDRRH